MNWLTLIPDLIKLLLEILQFIRTQKAQDPKTVLVDISAAFANARAALLTPETNEDDKEALKRINDLIRRGRP